MKLLNLTLVIAVSGLLTACNRVECESWIIRDTAACQIEDTRVCRAAGGIPELDSSGKIMCHPGEVPSNGSL